MSGLGDIGRGIDSYCSRNSSAEMRRQSPFPKPKKQIDRKEPTHLIDNDGVRQPNIMLITNDGKQVSLEDEIYVVSRKYLLNKHGRPYMAKNDREVAIYKISVTEIRSVLSYELNTRDTIHCHYASGHGRDVSLPFPTGDKYPFDGTVHSPLYASSLNSFATLENAQKALPEFVKRGFVFFNDRAMYADAV